ncbi:unnamed protein product [Durusdinium trenchii]|uniref:Uncharacterized protein n=1 Tax=Durusdinium trenchii TaxID=1381693 RepID=A0ABP0LEQ9_9DINO
MRFPLRPQTLLDVLHRDEQSGAEAAQLLKRLAPQMVRRVLDLMQEAGTMLDARNYTVGITLVAREKLWQDAILIFDSMSHARLSPNSYNYSATISACEKASRWQCAVQLFQEMQCASLADVVGFSSTISSCQKGSQWTAALQLFGSMESAKVESNVYSYSAAIRFVPTLSPTMPSSAHARKALAGH